MDSIKKNIPLVSKAQLFERLGERVYLLVVKMDLVDWISSLGKAWTERRSISSAPIYKKFMKAISSSKFSTLVCEDPRSLILPSPIVKLVSS